MDKRLSPYIDRRTQNFSKSQSLYIEGELGILNMKKYVVQNMKKYEEELDYGQRIHALDLLTIIINFLGNTRRRNVDYFSL